ncbi:MAG: CBS domain-containing protein, partial [Bacteroidota bacterium]
MSQQLSVDRIMTKELITFRKEEDIWEVINVIVKNKISGAPVVNDRGELIGMLSEADCIRVVLEDRSN